MGKEIIDPKSRQVLVITTPEKSAKATAEVIKHLTKRGNCIYMAIAKPAARLVEALEEQKINTKNIGFIDCSGIPIKDEKKVIAVPSPSALTEISIALTKMTDSGKYNSLYVDSISSLLIYNSQNKVERFIQYIINKASNMGLRIIILAVNDEKSKEVINLLIQITEKQVKF